MPDAAQYTLGLVRQHRPRLDRRDPRVRPIPSRHRSVPAHDAVDQMPTTPVTDRFGARTMPWPAIGRSPAAGPPAPATISAPSRSPRRSRRAAARPTRDEQARAAALHRLRRKRAGTELLPAARAPTDFATAGRRSARAWSKPPRAAEYAALQRATQYAHLHPRAGHPRHLARCAASRLRRRARAGTRHGHGPVLRADAGCAARDHAA